jgi:SAM-dependent methyltransferase
LDRLSSLPAGSPGDAYFREYVRFSSVAQSISRAIEARHLATVEQRPPMLDVGCGYGEFGRAFFRRAPDVGIDIRDWDLRIRVPGVYQSVLWCDARRMPLRAASFETVFSVSVLEHIPDVHRVIEETARVLRPGGTFAFTVPTDKLEHMLAIPRATRAARVGRIGKLYADRLNGMFDHFNLWPPERWTSTLEGVGLQVDVCRPIVSPRATAIFDLMLPSALPSQLGRLITKKRMVYRPPGMVNWLQSRFRRLVNEEEDDGSNLFVVARKPA